MRNRGGSRDYLFAYVDRLAHLPVLARLLQDQAVFRSDVALARVDAEVRSGSVY